MAALGQHACLSLRQRRGAGFDFVGPAPPPGATLTRASGGTVIDATGALVSVAVDVARFDHDPVSRAPTGLVIEPAATNLLTNSGDLMGGSGWTAGIGGFWTASASSAVGLPAGSGTALKLVSTGGTDLAVRKTGLALSGTVSVSAWFYVPAQAGVNSYRLINDAADTEQGSSPALTAFGRWVRTATLITTAASRAFLDFNIDANDGQPPAGFTVYLTAPQAEAGAVATSYVATTASTQTRSADVLTLDWRSRGVGDGVRTVRYTFDDGSSQDVATTIAGGTASVPTTLRRPRLIRAMLA